MIVVQLFWSGSGKSAGNQRVMLSFDGMRGVTREEITDQNGEASFDADPGSGKVIVDGTTKHHGRLEGRVRVPI